MPDPTYIKDNVLSTQSITQALKDQTLYAAEGLQGSYPFLRADRSGNHKLVFVLIQKNIEKLVAPKQVITASITDGKILSREPAEKFYASLHADIAVPVKSIRGDQDRETAHSYREKALPLMDEMRLDIIERGETTADKYMLYLKYALYPYTDELAERFLKASRIFVTASTIHIPCPACGKRFSIPTDGLIPGKLISNTCPICQELVQTSYVKTGRCITFTDRFMEEYRMRLARQQKEAEQEEQRTFLSGLTEEDGYTLESSSDKAGGNARRTVPDSSPAARVQETDPAVQAAQPARKDTPEGKKQNTDIPPDDGSVHIMGRAMEQEVTGRHPAGAPVPAKEADMSASDIPEFKNVMEAFRAFRILLAAPGRTPSVVAALIGNAGCGIKTSVMRFSGFQMEDISFLRAENATEGKFSKPCTVVLCSGGSLNAAVRDAVISLPKGRAVFFAGTREDVEAAVRSDPVIRHSILYRVHYRDYKPDTLCRILEGRLTAYGMQVEALSDRSEIHAALEGCNALDVTHACGFLCFRHLMSQKDQEPDRTVTQKELVTALTRQASQKAGKE